MAQGDGHSKWAEFIRDTRERTNLVDLVKESAPDLTQMGTHWKCSSPFRSDKTPSFAVYPDGGWYDYGTHERGDCFSFVMKRDGTDFKGSVSVLARRAGMELYWEQNQSINLEDKQWIDEVKMLAESQAIFEILTEAADYYHSVLPKKIREEYYNKNYGLSDETIDRLRLGYASGGLAEYFLETKGYSQEMLVKTGLFWKHQDKIVDLFQDRLFIPYWKDHKAVYAIARKTEFTDTTSDHEKAKYKKLPVHSERRSYISKYISNEFFYNEDVCFKKTDKIVITEGVTDCIAATQHGFACISPVTVQFRTQDIPKLIELLRRAKTQIVYLCNDADVTADGEEPGKKGALATAGALVGSGFEVRICQLPKPEGVAKVDLCEFLRDNGPEAFQGVLDSAKKYVEFLIDEIPIALDRSELDGRLKPLLETIAPWPDITRDAYTKHIASRFKISKKILEKAVALLRPKEPPKPVVPEDSGPPSARKSIVPDRQRGVVFEDIGFYYVEKQGAAEIISSFTLRIKEKISIENNTIIKCDIESRKGKILKDFTFPKNAWSSKRDFVRALPSPTDFQWTGTDDELQGLLSLLDTQVPTKRGVSNIGFDDADGNPKWIWHKGIITPEGFKTESEDVVYIPDGSNLQERILYRELPEESLRKLANKVLPDLFNVNASEVILPILGWFYATPFKSRIQRLLGHFPILHVWGTQGSGKTSIIKDIFWPLMAVSEKREPFSCTDTLFATTKKLSSTDSIPIFFDEYKPRDMGRGKVEQFHRILRRLYGGEVEERGRVDFSVVGTHLKAPAVIAGEMPVLDDPALTERIIGVSPNKNHLMSFPESQRSFQELRVLPLGDLAGSYVQWSLTVDIEKELNESKDHLNSILIKIRKTDLTPRIYDNLLVIVFGIRMFEQWAVSLGVTLPKIDPIKAFSDTTDEILQGEGSNTRDSFDTFLEDLSVSARLGLLEEGIHYAYLDGGKLCISLSLCYHVYCIEKRKINRDDSTGGLKALRRIIREKISRLGSYIMRNDHRVDFRGTWVRCVEIDTNMIPKSIDFEHFPATSTRSHGGFRRGGNNWGPEGGDA